jgi:hypothetical protein
MQISGYAILKSRMRRRLDTSLNIDYLLPGRIEQWLVILLICLSIRTDYWNLFVQAVDHLLVPQTLTSYGTSSDAHAERVHEHYACRDTI